MLRWGVGRIGAVTAFHLADQFFKLFELRAAGGRIRREAFDLLANLTGRFVKLANPKALQRLADLLPGD